MDLNKGTPDILTISASRLRVFKICPRQYYYKYILHYDDRPDENNDKNVAALLGSALHKAIQEKYINDARPSLVFQEYMNNTLEQWETKGYKVNALEYFPKALKIGKQILQDFDWQRFTPIEGGIEVNFTLPFPNKEQAIVNINGLIDDITIYDEVIDHKSATKAPNQDILNGDIQFLLYTWAYEQIYNKKPQHIYWNHLRTNKLLEYSIRDFDFKILQLTQDIQAMINTTHFQRRDIDDTCLTKCSFYELCYGKRAKDIPLEDVDL